MRVASGESVEVRLTRAVEAGEAANDGPGISVADAEAREAQGAVLSFEVTLDAAQPSAVSVRYATSDGTAVAGADYEASLGALRFEPGETQKTISVPVLNDTHNEGSETLTLTLSHAFGAALADGEATGTIVNTGPIPRAWIARFGRTVALQAVDAIGGRLSATRGTNGGQVVVGGAEHGGPSWTAWGRFATGRFAREESGLALAGDVTTGFLGVDLARERWLAGVALGASEGDGSFEEGTGRGTAESSLTGINPYARLALGDGADVWGLAGIGNGDLRLVVGEEIMETDLSMRMGAVGLRRAFVSADAPGAVGLALKTDALWVRTESDATRSSTGGNLEAASGEVRRFRVALEGSQDLAAGAGAMITPTLELGLRHDGGDAETGTGVEGSLGLRHADPDRGLTLEGRVRGLLAHAAAGYEEWGASASARLEPGASGRGISLSTTPVRGAAAGGVEQLWSMRPAAVLHEDDERASKARLQAELGYGLRAPLGRGVLMPYAGVSMEGDGRTYRLGARWLRASSFHLALEASQSSAAGAAAPDRDAVIRAEMRW